MVAGKCCNLTAQGDGRVVAGKSSGVKGDDGCWIMDVSRLLLDPHTHRETFSPRKWT